jgi:cytidylate kinase
MAVITMSRQYGSGGNELALRLCELLGYRFFDKSLMEKVAADVGLSQGEIVDFAEEHHEARGFLDRLFGSQRPVAAQIRVWQEDTRGRRAVTVKELDDEHSITMVQTIVKAAYRHGDIVIVGRGGQVVLKDLPGVLHVRIEAPLADRVQRVQTRETLGPDDAQELIMRRDKAAADYVKRFYGVDWADSTFYHLVINTGKWDVEGAAQLVVSAIGLLAPAASVQS